jgi:hypothetical protein
MKRVTAILLLALFAGCSGPEHISASEFKREYAMAGQPQSVKTLEFLGVHDGRAFLTIGSIPIFGSKRSDWFTSTSPK